MPTYEFGCVDCGHKFDIFATISQKESGLGIKCPQCGSDNAVQLFNSVNFVKSGGGSADKSFQGSGGCGCGGSGCC